MPGITALKNEDLERTEGFVINPNMKCAVLTMLISVIRTSGDACSTAAASHGMIKPVVLKVLMEMSEAQGKHMEDGTKPKTILEDVPVVERAMEYAPILQEIRWPLILST